MAKLIEHQYTYKKQIGFTEQQKYAFSVLKKHNVNICQFVRQAVKEKLQRDWKTIQKSYKKDKTPF